MNKWLIAVAVTFFVGLGLGIPIGRYHYKHVTLLKAELSNQEKLGQEKTKEKNSKTELKPQRFCNKEKKQSVASLISPYSIYNCFFGEDQQQCLRRLNLEDKINSDNNSALISSSDDITHVIFCNNKVCAVSLYSISKKFNDLKFELETKYKNYLIYDINDIPSNIKNIGFAIEDVEKSFVIKTKVDSYIYCVILAKYKGGSIVLKFISLDVLKIKTPKYIIRELSRF